MRAETITLEQVLNARDRRSEIQNRMLSEAAQEGESCLVCLTLNIAGEIKRTPMSRMLFDRGTAEFGALGFDVTDRLIIDEATGTEAFWLVQEDAAHVKRLLESVEDSFPAARLFDFDVLTEDCNARTAVKLSRAAGRKCLICGRPAAVCARSRMHGLDAVKAATDRLLRDFCAGELADAACSSLLDELYTTPKPGLVDLANCGAHTDMDVHLFEISTECLRSYFRDAALMGMAECSMQELRTRGRAAEAEMFEATGGVNTHKGMIYSMGLLLAGTGKALAESGLCSDAESGAGISADAEKNKPDEAVTDSFAELCILLAAEYAAEDAEEMLARSYQDPVTNGGRVLKEYGAGGATQQAATGFPDAVYCADRLNFYTDNLRKSEINETDMPDNPDVIRRRAGVLAFCDSMAGLEDTNLLHRGGTDGLEYVRRKAAEIAALQNYEDRIHALSAMDDEMNARGLSPGGSADMLALAYFIDRLRKKTALMRRASSRVSRGLQR